MFYPFKQLPTYRLWLRKIKGLKIVTHMTSSLLSSLYVISAAWQIHFTNSAYLLSDMTNVYSSNYGAGRRGR